MFILTYMEIVLLVLGFILSLWSIIVIFFIPTKPIIEEVEQNKYSKFSLKSDLHDIKELSVEELNKTYGTGTMKYYQQQLPKSILKTNTEEHQDYVNQFTDDSFENLFPSEVEYARKLASENYYYEELLINDQEDSFSFDLDPRKTEYRQLMYIEENMGVIWINQILIFKLWNIFIYASTIHKELTLIPNYRKNVDSLAQSCGPSSGVCWEFQQWRRGGNNVHRSCLRCEHDDDF